MDPRKAVNGKLRFLNVELSLLAFKRKTFLQVSLRSQVERVSLWQKTPDVTVRCRKHHLYVLSGRLLALAADWCTPELRASWFLFLNHIYSKQTIAVLLY